MASERDALGHDYEFIVQRMALVNHRSVMLTALGPTDPNDPDSILSSRVITVNTENPDSWHWHHWDEEYRFRVIAAPNRDPSGGHSQGMFWYSRWVGILNFQHGSNGWEPGQLDEPATMWGGAWIEGHFYGCGGNAFFGRRDAPGEWTYFSLAETRGGDGPSFRRIAGNTGDNIYLTSASYEDPFQIYHWNGTDLTPITIPDPRGLSPRGDTMRVYSVLVAPDGRVFLGGADGDLLVGTAEDGFEPLATLETDAVYPTFEDMAWYDDALWVVDGFMLYRLEGDTLVPKPFWGDGRRPHQLDTIQSGEGALLVGAQFGASLYNKNGWSTVFSVGEADSFIPLSDL